jgi:hypothetical protein
VQPTDFIANHAEAPDEAPTEATGSSSIQTM